MSNSRQCRAREIIGIYAVEIAVMLGSHTTAGAPEHFIQALESRAGRPRRTI